MLAAGSRLGPHEIVAPIGSGGMGEVYRARDTRLERTVAIKVLPSHMSSSPEVRQRFEREAKTISQLSHPHICALYDVGREGETEYLVMEYLEGETLSERLAKGALPLDSTLRYGQEIADALDKAHRQGIVHRDLKPANVMLTKSGVKLLDFGLAKAMAPAQPQSSLTSLPTQQGLTQEGTILGTFQYMAPEQLEGKEADARTDIFAFGATLYEMATGRKAFSGTSQASLIGAILHTQPPSISEIQPTSPPAFDRVVRTCLAKDPEERWQSAADIKRELRWIGEPDVAAAPAAKASPRGLRESIAWLLAAALALAVGALLLRSSRRSSGPAASPKRLTILPPPGLHFGESLAVSPDGSAIVFVASGMEASALWIRRLDSLEPRRIPGTEGANFPFWSPDSRRVGFFASGKLKTVDVANGAPPRTLCDVEDGRGGTWSPSGTIVFSPGYFRELLRVSEGGGVPTALTKLTEPIPSSSHRWPSFLPDGRRFLFEAVISNEEGRSNEARDDRFCVGALDRPSFTCFASGSTNLAYAAPGFLFFTEGRALKARPFDDKTLRFTGEPRSLAADVGRYGAAGPTGYSPFSVSASGLVAFGSIVTESSRLVWMDRSGVVQGAALAEGSFNEPSMTADGSRVVLVREEPQTGSDLWSLDFSRGALSRLTFYGGEVWSPIVSPDSTRVVYSLTRFGAGHGDLFVSSASGTGKPESIWGSPETKFPTDWSPDGRTILVDVLTPKHRRDIWTVSMVGDSVPVALRQTPFEDSSGVFSPDGKFFAYESDETGRLEIYIQRFPPTGDKWQVTSAGGMKPQWRRDGKELFYVSVAGELTAVDVRTSPSGFTAGHPHLLFPLRGPVTGEGRNSFVPSADGQRFLVVASSEKAEPRPVTVLLDWAAAPPGKE